MGRADDRTRRRAGPGWMVAAAFIGPGTVTTATVAGVRFGSTLLWALGFGAVATIVLQEMAARLGLATGTGLGEAIRERFAPPLRWLAVGLIVAAIGVGNAAYQTGNLLGAGLGLEALAGGSARGWAGAVSAIAFALLWGGSYHLVKRVLTLAVGIMGIVFAATALAVAPPIESMARGLLVPSWPDGAALLAVALVGTTVVPYNLFLHAAAVRETWDDVSDLPAARGDLALSIAVGATISMAIVVTAAGTLGGGAATIESAADMARALEPALGRWAESFFALGILAAGLTSSVTAPLAAAWATTGALGLPRELSGRSARGVWLGVLVAGTAFALSGVRPVEAIVFAQAANGVLLPAVALFLLVAMNDRRRLGPHVNGRWANAAGVGVVGLTAALGARAVLGALGLV